MSTPTARPPARSGPGPAGPPAGKVQGHPSLLFGIICAALGAFLALAAMTAAGARIDVGPPAAKVAPTPTLAAVRLTARGEVRPVAEARIGTLTGGTVFSLSVKVGQLVEAEQEIARVRHTNGMEVLTAPWRGLITSLPARTGDTVTVGTTLAYLGDLSRLQVETTDVDEFIIAYVREGQRVRMTVDAIDGRTFGGWVERLNLLPEKDDQGDDHYPVVIDFDGSTVDLRLGMTVRVNFGERP